VTEVPPPEYLKPLPPITNLNRPYWDGLREGVLRMQRCSSCHRIWYPPSPLCPHCWSDEHDWVALSGRATVNSWVVFHQAYLRGYDDEVPFNVAEVTLAEGPRLMTNLVDVANEDIHAGMAVEVVYDAVTDEVTLAKFRPVGSDG
jgi:uncharacterized OB-fold protein